MDDQLKYKVTYGFAPQHKEVEVYAFTLLEAIEVATKVMSLESGLPRLTRVEQVK